MVSKVSLCVGGGIILSTAVGASLLVTPGLLAILGQHLSNKTLQLFSIKLKGSVGGGILIGAGGALFGGVNLILVISIIIYRCLRLFKKAPYEQNPNEFLYQTGGVKPVCNQYFIDHLFYGIEKGQQLNDEYLNRQQEKLEERVDS